MRKSILQLPPRQGQCDVRGATEVQQVEIKANPGMMIVPGQGQQNNSANANANANSQPLTGLFPFEPQNVDADTTRRRSVAVTHSRH